MRFLIVWDMFTPLRRFPQTYPILWEQHMTNFKKVSSTIESPEEVQRKCPKLEANTKDKFKEKQL
jgi:hypothetical protein